MAKGDRGRVQNQADYTTGVAQNNLNNTRTRQAGLYSPMFNNYQTAAQQTLPDYNNIMGRLNTWYNPTAGQNTTAGNTSSFGDLTNPTNWMNLVGNTPQLQSWIKASYPGLDQAGIDYYTQHIQEKPGANPNEQAGSAAYWQGRMPEWFQNSGGGDPFYSSMNQALGGYGNFAETGGFSPQDIQNLQHRMIAPIRAIYSQANADVDRQRRQQHGYSPNYTAAKAKMAREQAYATSDATTNAEAQIAQMIQSGKLAGLGGLGQVGTAGRGQNLQGLNAQTNLFGTNPGLAQTFGNQALASMGQDIDLQKLQQALSQQQFANTLAMTQVPSNFQQALGYTGDVLGLIGQGADAASGIDWSKIFNRTPSAFNPNAAPWGF
jgi:hypothetical protein